MADEFENINSRLPDLGAVLAQRIAQKQGITPTTANFDPYAAMLKKKEEETAPIDPATIRQWPEADVKRLQDYCQRMGIVSFNCGRMHPIACLAMLRKEYGDDYTDVPLEERLPTNYEKLGTSGYGPSYPYSQAVSKKQILHG